MALQEFLVEGRNGGRCVMYKLPNQQIPQFEATALSKGVAVERRGKGREASTIYVCSETPDDISPLKNFVRNGIVIEDLKRSAA